MKYVWGPGVRKGVCHVLVRQAGRPQERQGKSPCPGLVISLVSGFLCPGGPCAGVQALQAGKVSKVLLCTLTSQGSSSCPATWWVMERSVCRQRPSGRCVGSRERKQLRPAWLPSGSPGWPSAQIPQSSNGHTGPVLPRFVFHVISGPLSHSRVGMSQKMLCRRLLPRPGEWGNREERTLRSAQDQEGPLSLDDLTE